MSEINQTTKVSVGFILSLVVGAWALFGYARDVEASLSLEKSERIKLEERVAWIIMNNDKRDRQILRLDSQLRSNGKQIAKVVQFIEESKR